MHMRKSFRMFLTLALVMLGVTTMSAGERISLQEVPFCTWDGWGADAQSTGDATCLWVVGEPNGNVYGDTDVKNYADLSLYAKLIVVATEGTPRFLFNRDIDEGQWNADEAQSHLIDNTKGGWSAKYFSSEAGENEGETIYTVDLKQMVKDKGYAHLHAIKGANWANVTILSMEVERQGKAQQVGWTNLINNSDMEGDDVSSFFTKVNYGDDADKVVSSVITDGVGVNGSRGIQVATGDKTANNWDNQFWFRFNEPVPAGTKYRVSFDYRADQQAATETQAHAEPSDYIHYDLFGNVAFTPDWQTFTKEGEVTAQQSTDAKQFLSVAFNLNAFAEANNYYFDNIKFEVYKYGTTAQFSNDVVLVDFGFDTNLPELVKAGGKPRLMYPLDCATVEVNGQKVELYSVEGFADGRFYIFLAEPVDDGDQVVVSFNNPSDAAFHLTYTSGPGGDVNNFSDVEASLDPEIENPDGYPYDFVTPTVLKADPEDGSFNLPNSIKEFKLVFDKDVDCEALKATFNGKAMTITPATGFAEEITLTRDGDADLATGEYVINVTHIYPKLRLADEVFGDYTITVNVGKVEYDPNDVAEEVLPLRYFTECANGGVPEGFLLVADGGEERTPGNNYGSGARVMQFAAGGDFVNGLYMRTYYCEYGTLDEEHVLQLEAGKKYKVTFNTCRWASAGAYTKFTIIDANGEEVMREVVENNPNMNEQRNAVNGSTKFEKNFIPAETGRYIMRWTVAKDANGTDTENDWQNGVILANVRVMYMPNQVGLEETQLLNAALENAKTTRDENADERYNGEAYDALVAAIAKYEAEKDGYTAPSAYKDAAAALDAVSQAVKDHRALCDNYDTQVKKAIDVVRQNRENKFANTELYGQLVEIVAKYNGTSEWVNVAEPSEDPEVEVEPVWQLQYSYDVLKDDAALTVAVAELTEIANTTSLLFTEGPSFVGGYNNGKGTGVAVLVERLRLGAEDLKALGVADDDPLIVAAANALTDDDHLAEKMKVRATTEVYGKLKDPNNTMFAATIDESTLEETAPEYDMTVFVKNPNIYKQEPNMNFTDESVPGWTVPDGYSRPGLSVGWGQPYNIEGIAEDCSFQTWGSSYRVEQTISDLPAGIYTIQMGFGEREGSGDNEGNLEGSFIFAKTSDTPYVEEGEEEQFAGKTDVVNIGQAFPTLNLAIEGIVVTDGILTIGANGGPSSHTFLNDVRLKMTAPVAGFNYAQAYEEHFELGVEGTAAQTATVRAIELYSMDGRRMSTANKGIVIVKKHMSDGTVRTEKVIRK